MPEIEAAVPDMESVAVKKDTALGITLQVDMSQSRHLVIQTYARRDDTELELNALLAKCCRAADRVELTYVLKDKKIQLDREKVQLAHHMEQWSTCDRRFRESFSEKSKRGDFKANQGEQQILDTHKSNQDRSRLMIEHLEQEIKVLEKELAPNGAANRN